MIPSDQAVKLIYGSSALGLNKKIKTNKQKNIAFKAKEYKASRFLRIASRDQGTKIDISVGVQEEEKFRVQVLSDSGRPIFQGCYLDEN